MPRIARGHLLPGSATACSLANLRLGRLGEDAPPGRIVFPERAVGGWDNHQAGQLLDERLTRVAAVRELPSASHVSFPGGTDRRVAPFAQQIPPPASRDHRGLHHCCRWTRQWVSHVEPRRLFTTAHLLFSHLHVLLHLDVNVPLLDALGSNLGRLRPSPSACFSCAFIKNSNSIAKATFSGRLRDRNFPFGTLEAPIPEWVAYGMRVARGETSASGSEVRITQIV